MREFAPPEYHQMVNVQCSTCESFPCVCRLHSPVSRECECGLTIYSASYAWEDVLSAVQRHNVEPVHERWRSHRESLAV